jgi:hypothetical protein
MMLTSISPQMENKPNSESTWNSQTPNAKSPQTSANDPFFGCPMTVCQIIIFVVAN